jgi:hypothetical protein
MSTIDDLSAPKNAKMYTNDLQSPNQKARDTPIKLIDFSKGFQINEEALDFLRSIKEEIIIVSVIGKARTGKSYLMNLLLDLIGKGNGFQVASSLQSCTKGIWLWGTPKNSLNGKAKIVFLDSEGTSSIDKSTKTYDSRIFALVVLISSLFLYNTYSNIDEHGINELSLAAHLSNAITTNSNIDKDELLTELSPKFIWIIRDFTLEKIHPETGEEISSKEYLELCLKNKRCGKGCNDNNVIRQNIIKFFPERDCVTLIRPVDSEDDLKKLNMIPYNNLKPEFKMEFKILKDKIFKEALPKKLNGKKLTGPALATLIEEFVKVINSGKIPNINNTWDSVIEKDVSDAFYKSYELFKNNSSSLKIGKDNIYNERELMKILYDFKYISMNNYDTLLQSNGDTFKQNNYKKMYLEKKNDLNNKIDSIIKNIISNNNSLSSNYCTNLINELFKSFELRLSQNVFNSKNYNDIIFELSEIMKKYNSSGKGSFKDETCFEFLKNKEDGMINILKEIMIKEGEKNMRKMENNIKLAQVDLDDFNNKKRVIDEKDKINNEKLKNLEKENNELEKEVADLNENLNNKKNILKKLKKRNELARKNRKKLEEMKTKEKDQKDSTNEEQGNEKKKRKKNEIGCQCIIY